MEPFVHLFCRSRHSLLRGTCSGGELAEAAREAGMEAVALTDHRALYGAVPFLKRARELGVRPLFGASFDTGSPGAAFVALARDARGFGNLCRLVTADQLARPKPLAAVSVQNRAEKSPPRDLRRLALEFAEGLIFLTSDAQYLRFLRPHLGGESLYAEYFRTDSPAARQRLRGLTALAGELGLRGAATNRVHFLRPEDYERHRLLSAIRERKTLDTLSADDCAPASCFFATSEQMNRAFADLPDALRATTDIARACDVAPPVGGLRMPRFTLLKDGKESPLPEGEDRNLLRQLCVEAIPRFYPPKQRAAACARLDYELQIICSMGYASYFLIVWDTVEFARREEIPLTGRGSAADSLVSYLLGFTHVDPIAHNLYFERFLNPERTTPPDVDLDLCWRRRDEVVDYVYRRWGGAERGSGGGPEGRVAMISTHVTLAGRACVRETGKAMGFSESEMSAITRHLPHYGSITLPQVQGERPKHARRLDPSFEPLRSIFPLAKGIEGFPSHLGVHASGIVVAPEPLTAWAPLERASKGLLVTQYEMHAVEDLGLLKIDLLGQRSLSVIADVRNQIRREKDPPVDLDRIDTESDTATQDLLAAGRTLGVFQVESPGMRGVLRKVRARDFETVTAASSVIRPGPKDAGMLRSWIRRRRGLEAPRYLHPRLEEVLAETYGIMIYQEDVLKVMRAVAGMSLGQADMMRRKMSGHGPQSSMREMERVFLGGARRSGVDPTTAAEIWRQIQSFAGYAFCKAHSASYTVLSFRSAYLKAHFPAEFMAAVLANGGGFYDRSAYVSEARRLGLRLLLPSVNRSAERWSGRSGRVRCGLAQIKGIDRKSIRALLDERERQGPFRSLPDALLRLPQVEKSEWDSLILSGACDDFLERSGRLGGVSGPAKNNLSSRPELLYFLDQYFQRKRHSQRGNARQLDLFDPPENPSMHNTVDSRKPLSWIAPEGLNMKVFDGFASPMCSEAEPGVNRKDIASPKGANKGPCCYAPPSPNPGNEACLKTPKSGSLSNVGFSRHPVRHGLQSVVKMDKIFPPAGFKPAFSTDSSAFFAANGKNLESRLKPTDGGRGGECDHGLKSVSDKVSAISRQKRIFETTSRAESGVKRKNISTPTRPDFIPASHSAPPFAQTSHSAPPFVQTSHPELSLAQTSSIAPRLHSLLVPAPSAVLAPDRDASPHLPEFPPDRLYDEELRALGVPIRCHPLHRHRALLPDSEKSGIIPASQLAAHAGRRVRVLGWLVTSRRLKTKKGSYMKFLTLEDETDIYEAILFDRVYRHYEQLTHTRGPYLVEGRVEEEEGHCSLNVVRLELLK